MPAITVDTSARPEGVRRTISEALRLARERDEQENLLADDEALVESADSCLGPLRRVHTNPHEDLPVYKTIHRIRRLILASIDDPYTLDQLQGPRINVALIRPLVERLFDPDDVSVVYCLLVNRMQFLRDQQYGTQHQSVNLTRAMACELLASKVLRKHHEENQSRQGLLQLANILVASFEPFQNAPEEVLGDNAHRHWAIQRNEGWETKSNALEIAIISEAKAFLSGTACQRVVQGVYIGRIIYTPHSWLDIIPDRYKFKGISLYDPRKASILNQYRLAVPRTRNLLEVLQFIILLVLFTLTMVNRRYEHFTGWEITFMIYALGWSLDEFASILEHGWHVHTQNLWSFLDITFGGIFMIYFIMRLQGVISGDAETARQALDILACAAPIVFPRIAFNLMPENMLFIALRAMLKDFFVLTVLAVWCFGGFLLALTWLSNWEAPEPVHKPAKPIEIMKWMLWIWFGLDGTGITRSVDFHLILGPALMVTFAFLGNTLFLTILVSMLSNTFSSIVANASQEIQFRRAVLTFEGVKSDALFAYRPPFNLLALLILAPLKFLLTPRWFHKVHITAVRVQNAPLLLLINLYERRYLWKKQHAQPTHGALRRPKASYFNFSQFSVHGDIQAVFEAEPPQSVIDEIEEEDELDDDIVAVGIRGRSISPHIAAQEMRKRRFSSLVTDD